MIESDEARPLDHQAPQNIGELTDEVRRNVDLVSHPRRVLRVFRRAGLGFWNGNGFMRASAMTYSGFLCIVPLTVLLSWMAWHFDYIMLLVGWIAEWDERFHWQLPLDRIVPVIRRAQSLNPGSLGAIGFGSLFVTFWLTMSNLEAHLNAAWNIDTNRPIWKTFKIYFPFLLVLAFAFGVLGVFLAHARDVSGMLLDPSLRDPITGIPVAELLNLSVVSGVGIALTFGMLFLIYLVLPARKIKLSAAAWSALAATVALVVVAASMVNIQAFLFTRYSLIYGSLAILPVLLLSNYILWVVVLFGSALGCSIESELED